MQNVYGQRRRMPPRRSRYGGLRLLICALLLLTAVVGRRVLPEEYRAALVTGLDAGVSCREVLEAFGASASSAEARQILWEKGVLEVFGLFSHKEEAEAAAAEQEAPTTEQILTISADLLEYPVIPVMQMSEPAAEPQETAPEEADEVIAPEEPEPLPEEDAPTETAPHVDENGRELPDIVSLEAVSLPFSTVTPVYGVLTSDFGYRSHPIDGEYKFHYGVDLAAPTGTEIGSFADGEVSFAGWGEINGYYIRVTHADGVETLYAHLSEILVSRGDQVDAGEVIGLVGETGEASGPHLHFQVYSHGILLDPLQYIDYML